MGGLVEKTRTQAVSSGKATGILFLAGRVTFLDPERKAAKANSGAPSCLVAFGWDDAYALYHSGIRGKYIDLMNMKESA